LSSRPPRGLPIPVSLSPGLFLGPPGIRWKYTPRGVVRSRPVPAFGAAMRKNLFHKFGFSRFFVPTFSRSFLADCNPTEAIFPAMNTLHLFSKPVRIPSLLPAQAPPLCPADKPETPPSCRRFSSLKRCAFPVAPISVFFWALPSSEIFIASKLRKQTLPPFFFQAGVRVASAPLTRWPRWLLGEQLPPFFQLQFKIPHSPLMIMEVPRWPKLY